jgi:hypothetical protein
MYIQFLLRRFFDIFNQRTAGAHNVTGNGLLDGCRIAPFERADDGAMFALLARDALNPIVCVNGCPPRELACATAATSRTICGCLTA